MHQTVLMDCLKRIATLCVLTVWGFSARATVYLDATNDLFAGAGAPQLDISSVTVSNDSANLYFTIKLAGNPVLTNWGSYGIALVTGPGGATNGNGTGAAISLTEGMNYWITSLGWGSQKLYQYNTNAGTWATNGTGVTFGNGSNYVFLGVPYAGVGLTNGQGFQFDVYTFSGTGGAMDDLANPAVASTWWSAGYTNNLIEAYAGTASTNRLYGWVYSDATNDMFTTAAPQFDISSVAVTNDATKITFTINVLGNPASISWDNYAIALATGPGGDPGSNGSGAAISLTSGMNFWVACQGAGSPQLWGFNTNNLTWVNLGGATFASTTNSVSLTVTYASLGLAGGAGFQFDAYTFSGTGGALDDLANPGWAATYWGNSYAAGLIETYPPSVADTSVSGYNIRGGLGSNDAPGIRCFRSSGGLQVSATNTVAGAQYIWESSPRLAAATWTPVSTNLGTGGLITNVVAPTGGASGFSRCKVQGLPLTLHTVGDSTVQIWPAWNYPKTGWGQVIQYFFNAATVSVDDAAVGGTSAKSFYTNYWSAEKAQVKAGDFVFIQFGINDGSTNTALHTDPETTFKTYLTDYVTETRNLGAYPVLLTPMRADIGNTGTPYGTYALAVRELAVALHVPLIDLDVASGNLIFSTGTNYATQYFYMNFPAGTYSNYPAGNTDATHFQEMGALEMAKLVVQGIQNLGADTNVCKLIPSLNPASKVTFSAGGTNGLVTLTGLYPAGVKVSARAIPATGVVFTGWSGDLTGTNSLTTFVMGSSNINITASFRGQ